MPRRWASWYSIHLVVRLEFLLCCNPNLVMLRLSTEFVSFGWFASAGAPLFASFMSNRSTRLGRQIAFSRCVALYPSCFRILFVVRWRHLYCIGYHWTLPAEGVVCRLVRTRVFGVGLAAGEFPVERRGRGPGYFGMGFQESCLRNFIGAC